MPLQDKIAHAAAVAKWKADQQMRLLRSQGRIGELEGQIRNQKAALADKTLALYAQELLTEDELKQICAAIAGLNDQIKEQHGLQETIRNERPPEQQVYSANYPPAQSVEIQAAALSGLICPQCGRALVGRFCPEHGVEGVMPPTNPEPVQAGDVTAQLVCPTCGKVLSGRFCPEHGVEGVQQSQTPGG